ncbi:ficolin-1-like [Drosophila innubila]|uniref:ficolin-1-like n=1 Tax=Drosophila innubila TaxID=198719 RepID=UPI00148C5B0C|nr:ficolin-1-like [Drosophila innubila]
MSSQLSTLRTEVEKLMKDGVDKELAIKSLGLELEGQRKCDADKETINHLLKAEVERQGKLIDELAKDRQEKLIDGLVKLTDIEVLKKGQDRLKKEADDNESEIQSLRVDLESTNQLLRAEVERQGKLIEELIIKSNNQEKGFNPHNCTEAKTSGIYNIVLPNFSSQPFKVACDAGTRGGGWTIILRRMDGSVEFHRSWTEYKNGFGELSGEFFLGLDKIHAITAERRQELLILLEDFEGDERFETYDEFEIGDEDQQYVLHTLGIANGTAGDSFSEHKGSKFSTFDRDNDPHPSTHCAEKYNGAWWYPKGCHACKLTGRYKDNTVGKGINWSNFHGYDYSLKKAVMMIRPKKVI